jgi:tetratricopeptide (TPR) repeat protein
MLAHLLRGFVAKSRSTPRAIDAARLLQRAESAIERAHWSAAEQVARQLTGLPDHEADAHHIRAVVCHQRFESERALSLVESSIALNPGAAHFHNTRGKILAALGRFPEAIGAYERAMCLAPDFGAYFMNYALAKKFAAADMPLIEAVERRLAAVPEAGENRANFQFALGKALDDCGLYDRAFPYFKLANVAKSATKPFAAERLIEHVNALRSVFDERFFARHRRTVDEDEIRPIFIVGMPRCGSTLLESLLSTDPDILAGGEQRALEIVEENISRIVGSPLPYPHCLREI